MNNFNKIKNMNVDEMSKFLSKIIECEMCPASGLCNEDTTYQDCPEKFEQWLLSEVENDR